MIEILRPDHPMLRGLRFLAIPDNSGDVRNYAVPGGGGVMAGGVTLGQLGKVYGSVVGDGTDNIVTFGDFNKYFSPDSRDITVIGRFRSNAAQLKLAVASRNNASPTAGWHILYANTGAGETGYNFTVWSSAGKFMEAQDGVGEAAIRNKDVVFAGVYDHRAHEVYSYLRNEGEPAARIRNGAHTNTNSANTATENWEIRAGAFPIYLLAASAGSLHFNGDVGWVAIFDRALSNDEIAEWSVDEAWPFLDDYPIVTTFTARQFSTVVGVSGSGGYSQDGVSREMANEVEAAVIMTGDLTNQGSGSATRTFRTGVESRQDAFYGIPLFKRFNTTVAVDGDLTPAETRTFRTRVGVRSTPNPYLDGRKDLLYTGGYRR